MSETVLEPLSDAVFAATQIEELSRRLRPIRDAHARIQEYHGNVAKLLLDNTRLRTLLDDLLNAVEPFANFATRHGLASDDSIVASAGNGGLGPFASRSIIVGNLRRAREAYLKAKAVKE